MNKRTKGFQLSRISELQEQIKDMSEQIECKELRWEGVKNMDNYMECDKLTDALKTNWRQLELELKLSEES